MVEEDRKKKEQESAEAISGLKILKYRFEIHMPWLLNCILCNSTF